MPVIGIAEILVQPVFTGMQHKISKEVGPAADKAGRSAGSKMGKGMADAFAAETAGLEAEVSRLGKAVSQAETTIAASKGKLATASAAESKALGEVRVAELKLQEIRENSRAKASQVAAAEEKLEVVRARATATAAARESVERNLAKATDDLGVAQSRAAEASTALETHMSRAGDEADRAGARFGRLGALLNSVFAGNPLSRMVTSMRNDTDRAGNDFSKFANSLTSLGSKSGRNIIMVTSGISAGLATIVPAAGAAGAGMIAAAGNALALASSLSSLAGIAALVPAGLMSIGAGAGVLVTAFAGVGEALKTALDASSGAVKGANPRLAAMALDDAARSIVEAEENAAEAQESAARRVKDAKRALTKAVEAAAEAQVAAVKAVEMAERSEAKAARDVIKAQKDLVRAREDASKKVTDIGRDLEEANRKVADTALAYQEAVALYEKATADPTSSNAKLVTLENDVTRALIADRTAKQSLLDLRDEHAKAQADAVDSNEKVLDAEQRLADARQAQVDAAQDRKDAQADVVKTEKEGAEQVADAQQAITDATKAAEKSQLDAARAIEQAHRNLERVQLQQADTAALAGAKSTEAMDNLTPSAQEAVRALLLVKEQLGGIRRIAQENFFKGFAAPLLTLAGSVMPQLATGVGAIASAMGTGARMFMGSLEGALGGGVLEALLMDVAQSTAILNTGIDPVVQSFTTLGVVGMKYMPRLAQFIADVSDRFNSFIQAAAADGSLDRWIEDGIQGLKDLWSIAGSVQGIFEAINRAAESAGIVATLGGMAEALRNVESAMQGPVFQTTMATIFEGAEKGAAGLLAALGPIGDAFVRGAPAMSEFLRLGGEIAGTFLGGVFTALSDPAFGSGLVTFMEGLQVGVEATAPHLPGMAAAFGALLTALAPIAEVIGPALVQVITFFAAGLADVITFLSPLLVLIAGSPTAMGILVGVFALAVVAAGLFTAAMAVQRVIVIGAWALMSAQALIHGARMALAWVIALGPIAWVIAAVVGLAALIILNWEKISAVTTAMWQEHVKPHLDAFFKFINETLPAAFEFGVGLIRKQWEKLQEIAKAPVKFVIQKVINEGLIDGLNGVGKLMGLDPLEHVQLPKGFARGGILPGQSSWRDGDDQLVPMRRGEGVYVSEVMRDPFERARLFAMNRAAVMGRSIASVRAMFGEGLAKGGLVHPVRNSAVSQPFHGGHNGIDFAAPTGTPVEAAGPGRVSSAGWSAHGGGNEIHIDHPNGLQTWYAHLSRFAVKMGDMVRGGQRIGDVGSTGNSTGPHLHYMVMNGGWPNYVNPADYLDGGGEAGSGGWNPIAGIVDGLVAGFRSAFPAAGFSADLAIGAGRKLLDGAVGFVTGRGGKDNTGSTGLPYLHDNGGVLQPGLSTILNRTRKPEAIYNHEQNRALQTLAARGAQQVTGHGFPDAVRLVVDGQEFSAYVDRRAGSVVQSADSQTPYRRVGR